MGQGSSEGLSLRLNGSSCPPPRGSSCMPPSPEDGRPPSEPKGGRQDGPPPPTAHSQPPQRAGPDAGKVPKWLKLPGTD